MKNLGTEHMHQLVNGKVTIGNMIKFHEVPLKAPNGDLLANNIRFWIKAGMNCLFIGPNGSGKSSLYRIMGQLWPLSGGELTVPHPSKIFYLPQRAYLPKGTLRDQMIYPDIEQRESDEKLLEILDQVKLRHLYEREGGFDKVNDWVDILSGGERQRICFSRILYHKPEFAILDECTSAVSMDFEHVLYTECKKLNITMFTISQRSSLYVFHDYILKFDGDKDWTFEEIIHEEQQDVEGQRVQI